MTNQQIINRFFCNPRECRANNLRIEKRGDNWILVNYYTDLVIYHTDINQYVMNETKYSPATSKIQSLIRSYIPSSDYTTVNGCKMGFRF
jgi:hypothetical protein